MVAIVTGNGLGLQSSSLGLGSKGQIGNAAFGQGGEQIYVNAANGNLVIRDRDELLLGQGIASELYRAYNSQGQLNGDAWRPGVSRTVDGLTGTLNTAGSTITRTDWDGSTVVYAYDTASQVYIATIGQGARDTLSYHAANKTWNWTQGNTRVTETYDATHNGRITTTVDTSGNTIHYAYNAQGLLSSVTTASGEVTYLDYSGMQLTQLRTVLKNANGTQSTQTAVRYSYDSLGRMSQVTVDLSPDDNSIADGKVYATTYTYDGSSSRIASITASDGSQVAFSYQLIGDEYRVTQIAETSEVGVVRVTKLSYDLVNRTTIITDPLGIGTGLFYDSEGRLTAIRSGVVGANQQQLFTYNDAGQLWIYQDSSSVGTYYTYDDHGNVISELNPTYRVTRTYNDNNQLLTETVSVLDTLQQRFSTPVTTHYLYDANNRLRFVVTPEGRVTEFRYNAAGQQISQLSYSGSTYAGASFDEASLAGWVGALGDKTQAVRTDLAYDFRGNLASTTQYSQLLANGEGDTTAPLQQTLYVYDPSGRLLQRYVGTPGAMQVQQFTYDGLGRLLTASQFDGSQTLYQYDDAHRQVTVTYGNGLTQVSTFNLAGELITLAQYNGGTVLSQVQNAYDSDGRLRMTTDANGLRTHYLYDGLGRKVAEIGPDGGVTEYVYERVSGNLGRIIRYATSLTATQLAVLVDVNGRPVERIGNALISLSIANLRPAASAQDRNEYFNYLNNTVLSYSVSADGTITHYDYQGTTLIGSTTYATRLDLTPYREPDRYIPPATLLGWPADPANDRSTRHLYDRDNRLVGELNAEGYLTEYRYNGAGQLIETIRYATAAPEAQRAKGALDSLRPAASAQDLRTSYHYDSRGLLTTEVDGEGWLTTYTYDAYGNVASRTRGQRVDPAQWNAPQQISISFEAEAPGPGAVEVWVDGVLVGRVTISKGGFATYTLTALNVVPLLNHTVELRNLNGSISVRNILFGDRVLGSDITLGVEPNGQHQAAHYTLDALQTLLAWSTLPGQLEQTQYAYDADGRLLSVTQVGLDGVVGSTAYTYDSQGRVTSETRDGRTVTYRYDLQGRLIGQLGGEGSAALAALGSNASQAAIDAVWNQYGVRYGYDAGGRRTSMTEANGATTLYYYTDAGQLAAVINALGEVVAYSSDVFGNLTQTTVYASRVATGTLGTLVGGLLTDELRQLLQNLSSSDDRITRFNYTTRGELATRTDALGYTTDYTYNAFGEATSVTQQLDKNGQATTHTFTYDRLGQQTGQTTDAGGLNLITQAIYDAFGRVIESIDANGIHRTQQYDTNGQLIVVTDGLGNKTQLSYDAFGNVLSKTDANGHTTRYQYSAFNRQVTMTTAEGITVTTQFDAFGQVIALTDGNGHTTRYQYNQDGQLTQTTDALNNSTKQSYNAAGQLIETTDARGTKTTYRYDAAGRVLTRTVDPTGLNLTTTYAYNAMGEVIRVTDPAGTVTETRYDANGQSVVVIVDPDGLQLTTTFAYDGAGNTVRVTEGAGSNAQKVTQYSYDHAGRLVSTVVDPNGLNLTTTYTYDGNGNAVAVTNANGHVTRYIYDANNQLTLTVDATGAVTRNVYDAAGNVIARTQYANRIDLSGLGNALSEGDITARLIASANDRVTRFAYDDDNRLRFTIDPLGYVTEQRYDANGNVVRSIAYSKSVNVGGMPTTAQLAATLAAPSYSGRYIDYVYDASDRLRYTVDSDYHVTEYTYDANGNQVARTDYLYSFTVTGVNSPLQTMGDMQAWTASHKAMASDRTSLFFYDSANRLVYERDALNYVTAYIYDAAGHVTARTRYDNAFAFTSTDTVASIATRLSGQNGTATQQRYDSAGRLTDVIDALGGITHHTLDAMGRVISTTVAYGTDQAVTTIHVFDAAGRAIEETRAAGTAIASTTRYVYDALGQLIQVVDPRGVALVTGPDSQALRDQRKALGVVDSAGNGKGLDQLSEADIAKLLSNYTTTTVYDAVGNAIQTQSPYGAPNAAGPAYAVVNTAYDAFGNAVKVTDARGYSGYFYYDGNNRVIAQVDPNGYLTTTDYNAFGEPITISQYVNRVVGDFDEHTRPIASNMPIDGAYVLAKAASDVAITRMTYDMAGRLASTTDAEGAYEWYDYSSFGQLMHYGNKLGGSTLYSYDKLGRLATQTIHVDGSRNIIVAYAYDARGNRTRESCSEAGVILSDTYYTYDALDRQITAKHPGIMVVSPGQTTAQRTDIVETQRYDVRGNVIERIDANGHRSVYYYDAANRLIGEIDAAGAYTQYDYDAAGNRTRSLTWSNPVGLPANAAALPIGSGAVRELQYTYDAANRLIQTFQPNVLTAAAGTAASNNTDYTTGNGIARTWVYDANGQLVLQTDGNGNISRTWYDAMGNAILSIDAEGYGVAWTRDANGNVLNETRFAQRYGGDPATLGDPNAAIATWSRSGDDRVTDYTYDKNGRVLSETRRSVVYGTVDAYGRLTQQTGDAATIYAYDKAGNLIKRVDANGAVYTFEYDYEGRLTATVSPSFADYTGAMVQTRTEYVFDALGRVVKETLKGSGAPDQVSTYTYDALSRLVSKTNALGQTTYMDYDAAGNLVQMRYTRTDSSGVAHNDVIAIQYDAANREVWRQTYEDGSTQGSPARRTQYNVYGEVTARGTGDTAWQETSEYDNAGRLIRSNAGDGITRIYLYDAEGNATMQFESQSLDLRTLAILDANGNVNLGALYDPNVYPWLSWTLTTYDGRNQVTDVIQPSMALDGQHLGLAPRPVAGGAPGQIGVEVGGPMGGAPQWPPISSADALKTAPGAGAIGPIDFTFTGYRYQRGQQYNYSDNWVGYNVFLPDLTALYGDYEILLTGTDRFGRPSFEGTNQYPPYTGHGDSTQGNYASITVHDVWAGGSDDNTTLTVRIALDIRLRSTGELIHLGDYAVPTVNRYQGNRDLVENNAYGGEVKASNLPPSSHLKLSPTDSSQLVGGAITAHVYVRAGGNGPYTELPISVGNPSTVDLGSLNPGWVYDVAYIAERPDGSLARSEHYTLTAGDNPTISGADQNPQSAWNTFGGGTFILADNALIGFNMRTSTSVPAPNATFRYRPIGAGDDAWSDNVQVGRVGFNGVRMPFDGIPDGTWEIDLSLCDANWNTLQHMTGPLTTGGAPSIALDYVHPAGNSITFTNIPLGADRVHLVLTNWVDGTPWDFGEFAITTPGTFAFDMPDWMLNQVAAWGGAVTFTVDATFTDDYIVPPAVYTAQGTLQAGNQRNPYSAINVQGNVYELNFDPRDDYDKPFDEGQYLLLRYWPEDADIVAHPELIQNVLILRSPDGQYHWDSIGLDPNQSYAYYYDVYRTLEEAQNPGDETELTRNEGYFTPSNGTSTEWQWVIDKVHNDAVTIHRHQSYNAFGEVASETDGRGNTVELYYNTLGNLTLKRDPLVQITYANGYQASIRPETSYSYDRTGRLVGQIDANGNVTTQIWNDGTGSVAQEFRADGGTTVYHYDVFGNQRVKIEALDVYSVGAASARRTDYRYDAGGNLITIERPAVNGQRAVDTYTYDEFGHRLTHTNSVTGTDTVDYDLEGNVSKIVSAAGRITTYTHAWDSSLYNGQGGWVQTTRLPYNPGDNAYGQSILVDVSTVFGQTTQHTDIAGRVTEYLYYNNGLLKQQGATQYTYYNNGLLHSMVDTENGTRGYYEYDNNGNLTFEGFTGKSGNWAFQQSVAKYDELNRLVSVSDPRYNIVYEYDAVGNRIHMRSEYYDAFGQPNQVQDYWYAYDQMNRFTTTMGQLSNGRGTSATDTSTVVYQGNGGDGVSIGYNAFGERMYAIYASDGHTERYEYDAQGYLTTTTLTNASGTAFAQTVRTNDLAGRVLEYVEWDLIANRVTQSVQHTWDNDSLLLRDRVVAWDASATDDEGNSRPRYTITVTETRRLADGTVSSTYTDYDSKNDGSSPHTYITTTYEYVWFDSAKQSTIKVQASNQDVKGWAPGLSAFEYDSFGRIKAAYDVEGGRGFAYQTDGEGRILQRDELLGTYDEQAGKIINATSNRWHAYYYLDDRQIGNVGNDGVERIDYAQELAQRDANNSNKDSSHKRFQPVAGADFDGNYMPINSLYPTAAPGSYIVHAGDTLMGIAMALWGDSSLWWLLADANGLSLNEPLIPNTVLTVPNKVTNIHNNASTFRPYDAGKALGNTNPTIPDAPPPPPPPGKKGCGGVLQIVSIAVAVAVTAMSGGTLGPVAAAMLGSVAGQGVLIAGGAQKGLDFKNVALAGVTAGVASGVNVGSLANSNSFIAGAIDGAITATATNVVGSITGMQSFNWKNIAAATVSSGVARGVSRNLPGAATPTSKPTWGNQLASQVAGGIGSAAVYGNLSQQALMGTTMNAIASTIGNSIAGQMAGKSQASSGSGNPYADVKRYADAVEAGNALGSSNLPPINIDPRSVIEPFTFDAQPLIGPSTLASIGPVLRSDVDISTLQAASSNVSLARVSGESLNPWAGVVGSATSTYNFGRVTADVRTTSQTGGFRATPETAASRFYDNAVRNAEASDYWEDNGGLIRAIPGMLESAGHAIASWKALFSSDNVVTQQGVNPFTQQSVMGVDAWNGRVDSAANAIAMALGGLGVVGEVGASNGALELVEQGGGIGGTRFYRTEGLGTHASIAELRATGALPGEQGVILTDRTVRFGDVYELGTLGGRTVEFSLVTEKVDGAIVKKIYSGDAWSSPVPYNARLIGHVHPNENVFKIWPSPQDMKVVNDRYFMQLSTNPNARPVPTRIFWGPGNTDNTIYYPGFGKSPLLNQN